MKIEVEDMYNRDITELYQEIGSVFRSMGADQVILLSSKVLHESEYELRMELVADGTVDLKDLQKQSRILWPYIDIEIIMKTDSLDGEILDEIRDYGILL